MNVLKSNRVKLDWKRVQPGWYEATDETGTLWRIVQRTSSAWEIIAGGEVDHEQGSLADAKWMVERMVARYLAI